MTGDVDDPGGLGIGAVPCWWRVRCREAADGRALTVDDVSEVAQVGDRELFPPFTCASASRESASSGLIASVARPSTPPSPRCASGVFGANPGSLVTAHDSNANGCSAASLRAPARSAGMPCAMIVGSCSRLSRIRSMANGEMSTPTHRRLNRRAASIVVPHPRKDQVQGHPRCCSP